jgi:hypothetical protein
MLEMIVIGLPMALAGAAVWREVRAEKFADLAPMLAQMFLSFSFAAPIYLAMPEDMPRLRLVWSAVLGFAAAWVVLKLWVRLRYGGGATMSMDQRDPQAARVTGRLLMPGDRRVSGLRGRR